MKLIKKLKSIFSIEPPKKTGNVVMHLLNTETTKTYSQEIYSITVFKNRQTMIRYLNSTVMTTAPRHINLLDYTVIGD